MRVAVSPPGKPSRVAAAAAFVLALGILTLPAVPALATGNLIDLSTNITQGPGTNPIAGTNWTYTIHVHNGGPQDSTGYTVTLDVPGNTSFVSADGCDNNTATVDCTSPGLTNGADETFAVTLLVAHNYPNNTPLDTQVTISNANGDIDPNAGNDTSIATATVGTSADVRVSTHSSSPIGAPGTPLYAGNFVVYTVTAQNNGGPSDAQNVNVAESLAGSVTTPNPVVSIGRCIVTLSEPCTDPTHFSSYTNGTDVAVGTLAPGDDATVMFRAQVKPSFLQDGNSIAATATANSRAAGAEPATGDPAPGNNSTLIATTVNTLADVQVLSHTSSPAGGTGTELYAGNFVTYTVTAKNNGGPSDAQNVNVSETLATASLVAGTIGSCVVTLSEPCTNPAHFSSYLSGSDVAVGTLAPGDTATAKFRAQVKPSFLPDGGSIGATGSANSRAAGAVPATTDSSGSNNNSVISTTVNTLADVRVSPHTSSPAGGSGTELYAGNYVIYTLVAENNGGPSDAQNVNVAETLPIGSLVAGTITSCIVGSPGPCAVPGDFTTSYTSGTDIPVGTLAPGATATVKFRAQVKPSFLPDGGSISATATANSRMAGAVPATTDSNGSNNTSGPLSTTVNTLADVQVDSIGTATTTPAGDPAHTIYANTTGTQNTVTYTIQLHNGGPSDAQAVVLTDSLPSELTGTTPVARYRSCVDTGTGCTFGSWTTISNPALQVSVSLGTLTPGTSATVQIEAHADPGLRNGPKTGISDSASANSTTSGLIPATLDPATGNNTGTTPSLDAVTIDTVPGKPTNVEAKPGNESAVLTWLAPSNNGGKPVTSYTITAHCTRLLPLPAECLEPVSPGFTGLLGNVGTDGSPAITNGQSYTFTVQAVNAVGTGDPSLESNPIKPSQNESAEIFTTGTGANQDQQTGEGLPSTGDPLVAKQLKNFANLSIGTIDELTGATNAYNIDPATFCGNLPCVNGEVVVTKVFGAATGRYLIDIIVAKGVAVGTGKKLVWFDSDPTGGGGPVPLDSCPKNITSTSPDACVAKVVSQPALNPALLVEISVRPGLIDPAAGLRK
jgi:uncharacterized repeat protein (TIGR01451 family)